MRYICEFCELGSPTPFRSCPSCGRDRTTQIVEIGIAVETDSALSIAALAISGSPTQATYRIQFQSHAGTRSDSRIGPDGVIASITGVSDVGRRGEPSVISTLVETLRNDGFAPTLLPASDEHGEDAVMLLDRQEYTVQIVTVPLATQLWADAARGSANTHVPLDTATTWVRNAIVAKAGRTPVPERASTIIGLDARFLGVLSSALVSNSYLAQYGDPQHEFGLAATWIVGPTPSTSTRIRTIL